MPGSTIQTTCDWKSEKQLHLEQGNKPVNSCASRPPSTIASQNTLLDLPQEILREIFRHLLLIRFRLAPISPAKSLNGRMVEEHQRLIREGMDIPDINYFTTRRKDLLYRSDRDQIWPEILRVCRHIYVVASSVLCENELIAVIPDTYLESSYCNTFVRKTLLYRLALATQIYILKPMVTFKHALASPKHPGYYLSLREPAVIRYVLREISRASERPRMYSISIDHARAAGSRSGLEAVQNLLRRDILPWLNDLFSGVAQSPPLLELLRSLPLNLKTIDLKDRVTSLGRVSHINNAIAEDLRNIIIHAHAHEKRWDISYAATIVETWVENLSQFVITGDWAPGPDFPTFEREAACMLALIKIYGPGGAAISMPSGPI